MAPRHWLVKSEPGAYAWDDLVRDGCTGWDGVRNPQACGHLQGMRRGDLVLYYHSNEKQVVGVARVTREAYPDPTAEDARWLAVELRPLVPLARPVPLAEIKRDPRLAGLPLVRQARLSVMPIDAPSFGRILRLGGTRLAATRGGGSRPRPTPSSAPRPRPRRGSR